MKIMQVITKSSLGGAQSVVLNLANQLCNQGHEVIVVAGADDGKMWKMLHPGVIQVVCGSIQRAVSPFKDLKAVYDLKQIYKKYQPDVVHLHSSKAGLLGRLAFPKSKIVYTVHGFASIRYAFKFFLPLEKMMQHRCASIIAVSKHDVDSMAECGITRRVDFIYNGVHRPNYDNTVTWNLSTEKYKKVVLCIARMAAPKRSDLFLQMAEKLPHYAFVWIGNETPVEHAPKNAFFLGNIPGAVKYCQIADLFVLPSDYEGLPMGILEAMSYGLPVVASNVGGVKEIVVDGETGYAVNNQLDEFTHRIEQILEDEKLYKSLKKNAETRFEKELTSEHMLEGYFDIYKKIAGK